MPTAGERLFFGDFLWTSKESYPAAGRDRRFKKLVFQMFLVHWSEKVETSRPRALRPAPRLTFFLSRPKESKQRKGRRYGL
jgi:hypothetical protein